MTREFLRDVLTLNIVLIVTVKLTAFFIFEQRETHEQLKERESIWQHGLRTFYPIALNKKEEYLY